jgi:hypothetical protein
VNSPAKDKPGYWQKKLANMRAAKALRQPTQRDRELREEEVFRLGLCRKNRHSVSTFAPHSGHI